jgi:enamine deaminase RidA (YjgF/YER057c/UK114 family)
MDHRLDAVDGLYEGTPYSYAALAPAGAILFTAGACPLDADGDVVGPGDVRAQARQALANLLAVLESAGCGLGDVVKTTVYVASPEHADLLAAWDEVEGVFDVKAPPSTLLGVGLLGYDDQLFEIEAIAVLPT